MHNVIQPTPSVGVIKDTYRKRTTSVRLLLTVVLPD